MHTRTLEDILQRRPALGPLCLLLLCKCLHHRRQRVAQLARLLRPEREADRRLGNVE